MPGQNYFAVCERDREGHCLPRGTTKNDEKEKASQHSPEASRERLKKGKDKEEKMDVQSPDVKAPQQAMQPSGPCIGVWIGRHRIGSLFVSSDGMLYPEGNLAAIFMQPPEVLLDFLLKHSGATLLFKPEPPPMLNPQGPSPQQGGGPEEEMNDDNMMQEDNPASAEEEEVEEQGEAGGKSFYNYKKKGLLQTGNGSYEGYKRASDDTLKKAPKNEHGRVDWAKLHNNAEGAAPHYNEAINHISREFFGGNKPYPREHGVDPETGDTYHSIYWKDSPGRDLIHENILHDAISDFDHTVSEVHAFPGSGDHGNQYAIRLIEPASSSSRNRQEETKFFANYKKKGVFPPTAPYVPKEGESEADAKQNAFEHHQGQLTERRREREHSHIEHSSNYPKRRKISKDSSYTLPDFDEMTADAKREAPQYNAAIEEAVKLTGGTYHFQQRSKHPETGDIYHSATWTTFNNPHELIPENILRDIMEDHGHVPNLQEIDVEHEPLVPKKRGSKPANGLNKYKIHFIEPATRKEQQEETKFFANYKKKGVDKVSRGRSVYESFDPKVAHELTKQGHYEHLADYLRDAEHPAGHAFERNEAEHGREHALDQLKEHAHRNFLHQGPEKIEDLHPLIREISDRHFGGALPSRMITNISNAGGRRGQVLHYIEWTNPTNDNNFRTNEVESGLKNTSRKHGYNPSHAHALGRGGVSLVIFNRPAEQHERNRIQPGQPHFHEEHNPAEILPKETKTKDYPHQDAIAAHHEQLGVIKGSASAARTRVEQHKHSIRQKQERLKKVQAQLQHQAAMQNHAEQQQAEKEERLEGLKEKSLLPDFRLRRKCVVGLEKALSTFGENSMGPLIAPPAFKGPKPRRTGTKAFHPDLVGTAREYIDSGRSNRVFEDVLQDHSSPELDELAQYHGIERLARHIGHGEPLHRRFSVGDRVRIGEHEGTVVNSPIETGRPGIYHIHRDDRPEDEVFTHMEKDPPGAPSNLRPVEEVDTKELHSAFYDEKAHKKPTNRLPFDPDLMEDAWEVGRRTIKAGGNPIHAKRAMFYYLDNLHRGLPHLESVASPGGASPTVTRKREIQRMLRHSDHPEHFHNNVIKPLMEDPEHSHKFNDEGHFLYHQPDFVGPPDDIFNEDQHSHRLDMAMALDPTNFHSVNWHEGEMPEKRQYPKARLYGDPKPEGTKFLYRTKAHPHEEREQLLHAAGQGDPLAFHAYADDLEERGHEDPQHIEDAQALREYVGHPDSEGAEERVRSAHAHFTRPGQFQEGDVVYGHVEQENDHWRHRVGKIDRIYPENQVVEASAHVRTTDGKSPKHPIVGFNLSQLRHHATHHLAQRKKD